MATLDVADTIITRLQAEAEKTKAEEALKKANSEKEKAQLKTALKKLTPKKTVITSVKCKGKKVRITWKKVSKIIL